MIKPIQIPDEGERSLFEFHIRVREASRAGGRKPVVEPFLPVDVLGVHVFLPV